MLNTDATNVKYHTVLQELLDSQAVQQSTEKFTAATNIVNYGSVPFQLACEEPVCRVPRIGHTWSAPIMLLDTLVLSAMR